MILMLLGFALRISVSGGGRDNGELHFSQRAQ